MIILPTEPVPAVLDLTANNIMIQGDYGIGKSGLLASTGYLIGDPEGKLRAYPCLRVNLSSWKEHLELRDAIAKVGSGKYPGIGLDSLNISYDHALTWVMANVKFAGNKLNHPSENPQLAYPRITYEFTSWLRDMTLLGYHVIATCHINIAPIRDKKGNEYNRWIPAFTGGAPTSAYANVLKIFSIIGFMTIDEVEKPAVVLKPSTRTVMGKAVADARVDSTRLEESRMTRVIYFKQDPNWLASNKFGGFPDRVVLNDRWQDDWRILREAWGLEDTHTIADEPVEANILDATGTGSVATGLTQ